MAIPSINNSVDLINKFQSFLDGSELNLEKFEKNFQCPITCETLEDPVCLLPCMHRVSAAALDKWFKTSNTRNCPTCRQAVETTLKDRVLKDIVGDFFGNNGLQDTIQKMQVALKEALSALQNQASAASSRSYEIEKLVGVFTEEIEGVEESIPYPIIISKYYSKGSPGCFYSEDSSEFYPIDHFTISPGKLEIDFRRLSVFAQYFKRANIKKGRLSKLISGHIIYITTDPDEVKRLITILYKNNTISNMNLDKLLALSLPNTSLRVVHKEIKEKLPYPVVDVEYFSKGTKGHFYSDDLLASCKYFKISPGKLELQFSKDAGILRNYFKKVGITKGCFNNNIYITTDPDEVERLITMLYKNNTVYDATLDELLTLSQESKISSCSYPDQPRPFM